MDLDVRHLRVIYAIAEAGSLRRASTALHVSQPALTTQLQRIERIVGGRLFQRNQAGAEPTLLGAEVVARTRAVLRAFDQLQRDITTEKDPAEDRILRLRIAASEGPLLGGMVARLHARFPDAEVTVRSHNSDRPPTAMLATGLVDLVISGDYPGHEVELPPDTVACPVVTEPTFAVLPAGSPICARVSQRDEVGLDELARHEWVMSPENDGRYEYILGAFERHGVRLNVPYRAAGSSLKSLVRAGSGLAFAQATSPGGIGLAIRGIAQTPIWYRHVLVWRRNHPISRHAAVLRQAAIECYVQSIDDSPVFQHWLCRQGMMSDLSSLFALESAEPFGIVQQYKNV